MGKDSKILWLIGGIAAAYFLMPKEIKEQLPGGGTTVSFPEIKMPEISTIMPSITMPSMPDITMPSITLGGEGLRPPDVSELFKFFKETTEDSIPTIPESISDLSEKIEDFLRKLKDTVTIPGTGETIKLPSIPDIPGVKVPFGAPIEAFKESATIMIQDTVDWIENYTRGAHGLYRIIFRGEYQEVVRPEKFVAQLTPYALSAEYRKTARETIPLTSLEALKAGYEYIPGMAEPSPQPEPAPQPEPEPQKEPIRETGALAGIPKSAIWTYGME